MSSEVDTNRIIEHRLLYNESAVYKASMGKILEYFAKLSTTKQDTASQSTHSENLTREVLRFEMELKKHCRIIRAYEKEEVVYQDLENQYESEIAATTSELESLEQELQQEKLIRDHRFKLEEEASKVNVLPDKATLEAQIQNTNKSIAEIVQKIDLINQRMNVRKEQYMQLEEAINSMLKPVARDRLNVGGMVADDNSDNDEIDENLEPAEDEDGEESDRERNQLDVSMDQDDPDEDGADE